MNVIGLQVSAITQNEEALVASDYVKVGTTGLIGRTYAEVLTDLGATTVGTNMFKLTNPSAITFPRINANNSISAISAESLATAIGALTTTNFSTEMPDLAAIEATAGNGILKRTGTNT